MRAVQNYQSGWRVNETPLTPNLTSLTRCWSPHVALHRGGRTLALVHVLMGALMVTASAQDKTFFTTASCVDCHDGETKKGGLDLTTLTWNPAEKGNAARWEKIHDRVDRGEMPPPNKTKPEPTVQAAFLTSVANPLRELGIKQQAARGRTGLRRLNRTEYENTVQWLLGIDVPLQQVLPEESSGQAFDTVADGLRFSQLQIEKYLEAADLALDAALNVAPPVPRKKERFALTDKKDIAENIEKPQGTPKGDGSPEKHQVLFRKVDGAVAFFTDTYQLGLTNVKAERAGTYTIRISGSGFQSRGEPVTLLAMTDNHKQRSIIGTWELPPDKPRVVEVTTRLAAGDFLRIAPFDTNFDDKGKSNWGTDAAIYEGVGMAIQWVEIEGPLSESWPPQSIERVAGNVPRKDYAEGKYPWRNGEHVAFELMPEDAAAALAAQLPVVAARAFRRPLEPGETDATVKLAQTALAEGASFTEALRTGIKAILTSPQFLLFDERPGPLNGFAMANRLSYFLWSGPPDEELLTLAQQDGLSKPDVLRAQVRRMLQHERAGQFVRNFTGQWLGLRTIDATSPDMKLYPEFDEVLKRSMVGETEAFFAEMVRENRPITDFIQSDWLMINRRLGRHYDVPGATTEQYQRVAVPAGSPRGGLLTQAAILKVTANGTTTSPVVRGTWVMKRLLGKPPAPPPPVPAIEPDTRGATTVRELLAKHRSSETCNSCHRNIDPPGFALESFDVIGGWRERYRSNDKGDRVPGKLRGNDIWQYKLGLPVDSTGQLPDGQTFTDITSFKKLLLADSDTVLRAVAGKLLVYGTGANLDFADRTAVAKIAEQTKANGGGLRTLIEEVVVSAVFGRK